MNTAHPNDTTKATEPDEPEGIEPRLRGLVQRWGKGRPRGAQNKATRRAQEFAEQIILSEEYRQSLRRRIVADTLPAQIETLLLHYGFGKPKEKIEVSEAPPELDEFTSEQLALRAKLVAEMAAAEVDDDDNTETAH